MTRSYRDISQYQNGASITNSSATLTLGTLLTGRGLAGLPAPYTLVIEKSDGTNREDVNINSTASFPQLGIDRGLNGTAAVSHDTTELVTMLVGENDLQNFAQLDGGLQGGQINVTGPGLFGGKVQGLFHQGTKVALIYAATISLDPALGELFTTATTSAVGNATINAAGAGGAGQRLIVQITNDATAARTITFGTNFSSSGTLTGTAGQTAAVLFESDGTGWFEVARSTGGSGIDIGSDSANIAKINLTDQGSAPTAPAVGHHLIYSKSDGIYMETSAGVEALLSGSSAGSGAELGYAQITASQTGNFNATTDITGLSLTVMVPAGGVMIEAFLPLVDDTANGSTFRPELVIFDSTANANVQIGFGLCTSTNGTHIFARVKHAPGAGSRSYKAQIITFLSTSTNRVFASANAPAFIRVTAI